MFGGYTPVPWDGSKGWKNEPDDSDTSFLFTLKNPRNGPPTKFAHMKGEDAIGNYPNHGPVFAGNEDMGCENNSNTRNYNWTNLGGAYLNTTGLDGTKVFTGKEYFTAKEIEVCQVV
jgi:hypothetical protein